MEVKNSLVNRNSESLSFQKVIKSANVQQNIMETLGDASRSKRFTASLISAVSTNRDLQKCNGVSIISAALLGESLNLSPSPQLGHYYMVPFNDNKTGTSNAQFILGYHGFVTLAIRSGQYKRLNVISVKEGELNKFNPFDETIDVNPIEDPDAREKAPTVGYYAMFELNNGFRKSMYWSKEKMIAHAEKYSMGFKAHKGYTFWEKDFDGMAYKTMLRQLISKWGITSIDMQNAYSNDMAYRDSLDPESAPKYAEPDEDIVIDSDASGVNSETGEVQENANTTANKGTSKKASEIDYEPEQESLV